MTTADPFGYACAGVMARVADLSAAVSAQLISRETAQFWQIVTAIGLLVAIPSVLAFNLLSARADTLLLAIDLSRGEFLDYLENQRGGSGEHGSGAKRGEGADVRRAVGVEARASA